MRPIFVMFVSLIVILAAQTAALADAFACKEECVKCSAVCKKAVQHCTEMGGEHANSDHLQALNNCVKACDEAAMAIGRKDPNEQDMCKTCMDACTKCANMCEAMKDDKVMERCARECRMCVKALKARWGYNDAIRGTSEH